MFYSKTILARKGPLGTVWCAAHLHHKLNKSHYLSTNVPTTVERIMYPEVPIALRMSSHLLLGVVRIYSKQVEYFFQDCNILLIGIRKAFAFTDVNLPESATHATVESVTLQDKFQLDAMDLDTDFRERFHDSHIKDPKEISLEDQILVGQDPYIVVSFDEDVRNSPCSRDFSECRPRPMQEDNCLYTPVGATIGALDPGPSNQERVDLPTDNNGPPSYPEIEIMRDASLQYFSESDPVWPDQSEDRLEPDLFLMEILKQKETDTLAVELDPGVSPLPPEQHEEPIYVVSEEGPEILNTDNAYGQVSPKFAISSTPPAQHAMPKQKRGHHYDDITVLSNRFMNQQMNDSSCILRKRKECPTDPLGNWNLNKKIKNDAIFFEPLLTGLCGDLCDAYQKDFISVKPNLTIVKEACPRVAEMSTPVNVDEMEIESLRDHEMPAGNNSLPELVRSSDIVLSSPARLTSSPTREQNCTPAFGTDNGLLLNLAETTYGGTSNLATFTGTPRSGKVTPMIFSKDQPGVEDTFRTNIPVLGNSVDGELSFLAEDDNNLSGPHETPNCFLRKHSGISEIEPLSARTRAVAQFLKSRLSITPSVDSQSVDVSLKTILEGQPRRICARMVFETLVLKNCGLVDVHQEESFGDVTLTVTQKLSKKLFST